MQRARFREDLRVPPHPVDRPGRAGRGQVRPERVPQAAPPPHLASIFFSSWRPLTLRSALRRPAKRSLRWLLPGPRLLWIVAEPRRPLRWLPCRLQLPRRRSAPCPFSPERWQRRFRWKRQESPLYLLPLPARRPQWTRDRRLWPWPSPPRRVPRRRSRSDRVPPPHSGPALPLPDP